MPSSQSSPLRRRLVALLLAMTSVTTTTLAQNTVSISPSVSGSSAGTLSPTLSPSFAGLGIEPSNLMAFTGTNTLNQLTYTLLANLGNFTGVPPHLRIGGNTGDNMLYDPSITAYNLQNNPNPTGGTGQSHTDTWFFGPMWFAALDRLPPKTPITYGLNLAYQGSDAAQRILLQANASMNALKSVRVVGLEIGNEPDLFVQNGYRTSGWSSSQYGTEWGAVAQQVYDNVLKPLNISSNFFEPGTTATTADSAGQAFRISNLVNTGVATENGIYVAGWNQHDYYYYTGVSTFTLTMDYLLDLSNTRNQFGEWAQQAGQAGVTGKPYYLREMGSVGPTGQQGISDAFGNTLWTLNFFLYAATVQVSSVQIHMTDNSYGAPWEPGFADGATPHVRSSYYAFAAISQIIGTKCNTQISSIDISGTPSGYSNRLAAYGIYRGGNLGSIVLLNTQTAYTGSNPPSVTFSLSLPSLSGRTMYVSELTATGSDATTNTTWNGLSFEASGNGTPTKVAQASPATYSVGSGGTISVPVRDSQAIVLNVDNLLGSDTTVDVAACAKLAGTTPEGGESSTSGGSGNPVPTFRATTGFASDNQLSTGGIIGIFAGAFVFLLAVGFIIFLVVWRRNKRRPASTKYRTMWQREMNQRASGRPSGDTLFYESHSQEHHSSNEHTFTPPPRYHHLRQESGGTPSSSRTWGKNDIGVDGNAGLPKDSTEQTRR